MLNETRAEKTLVLYNPNPSSSTIRLLLPTVVEDRGVVMRMNPRTAILQPKGSDAFRWLVAALETSPSLRAFAVNNLNPAEGQPMTENVKVWRDEKSGHLFHDECFEEGESREGFLPVDADDLDSIDECESCGGDFDVDDPELDPDLDQDDD